MIRQTVMEMKVLSATTPTTYSLLSIGQRGVGKTVFLAGSYTELHPHNNPDNSQNFWFECQDSDVQAKLESIKNHISRTGQYPPATIKITNFNFSLQQKTRSGVETVCNFHWWDIPGELCNIHNPEFQEMIFSTHGCCVFINAYALLNEPEYAPIIEDIYNQVAAIASVIYKYSIKYSFALILTQCDLIDINPTTQQQIDKKLEALTSYLDTVQATYQKFYSAIPIVSDGGSSRLQPKGAANSLLWLLLSQANHPQENSLAPELSNQTSNNLPSVKGQRPSLIERLRLTNSRPILIIYLISIGLLGAVAAVLFVLHLSTPVRQEIPPAPEPVNPASQN